MSVVAAFLVPGSPLPFLNRDNPPYRTLVSAFARAARGLAAARPDAVLLYSTLLVLLNLLVDVLYTVLDPRVSYD